MSIFGSNIKIDEKLEKWFNLDFSAKNLLFLVPKNIKNWIFSRKLVKK